MTREQALVNLFEGSYESLSKVSFEMLSMIQKANGEQLVFLELFKCLKKISWDNSEELDLRLIIIVEEIAYIKKNDEDTLYIVKLESDEQLPENIDSIILLKNVEDKTETDLTEEILSILNSRTIYYEKMDINTFPLWIKDSWKLDQIINVNLNVLNR